MCRQHIVVNLAQWSSMYVYDVNLIVLCAKAYTLAIARVGMQYCSY
jgi:hypothetical protein